MKELAAFFPQSGLYLTVVPSYIGGFMALSWASKGKRLGTPAGIKKGGEGVQGLTHQDGLLQRGHPRRLLCAAGVDQTLVPEGVTTSQTADGPRGGAL